VALVKEKNMAETKTKVVELTAEEKWEKEQEELFKKFVQLNVNDKTELKNNLTYLSWAWAWQETLKICPTATYKIKHFLDKDGVSRCYQYDPILGYMVFTEVTIDGLTREMWLPVMDGANKSMLDHPYTYTVGKGDKQYEKSVEQATMFDINKTIMRCLTKNLAMFGLGIYIYAGEDLPIEIGEPISAKQLERIKELNINTLNVCKRFKVNSIEDLTYQQAEFAINTKEKALEQEKSAKGDK
jgi:hypothetical protein